MKTFEELGVSPEIRKAIEEMGYANPMPVQEEVIPYLLGENNDVVALAQTGTGKTAAYGLPLIQGIDVKLRAPQALILCPTRELCLQISGDLTDYSKYVNDLKVLPVYGGSSIESQIRSLKKGVHIIVATPGRLIDLMERKTVSLAKISNVVMDEADEMLNMGFTESINTILAQVPENKNTLLFSATMSPEISRISKNYLRNAKEITIGHKNESTANVEHIYYMVHAKDKFRSLKRVVDSHPEIYGIIFCRTRIETQEIADKLIQNGYSAEALHGELSQQQRDLTMQKFRTRSVQLLVATDVAARGLDVEDLTHVINYGLPDDIESYTHRSGRTGRAGKTGTSISIINLRERGKIRAIERIIAKKFIAGTLPSGKEICEKQLLKVIDEIEKVKVNEDEIQSFLPTINRKLDWLDKEDLIKRVVSLEFNRFLEYYHDAGDIEVPVSGEERRGNSRERGFQREGGFREGGRSRGEGRRDFDRSSHEAQAGFTRLFINVGKMDDFYPPQLIDLINKRTHTHARIGKIDLMKNFSFFEIEESQAKKVINALNKEKFNDRPISVEIAGEEKSEGRSSGDSYSDKKHAPKRNREERGYPSKRGPKEKK
jgi:ATP-dependent RNA helicase DeaD